VNFYKT